MEQAKKDPPALILIVKEKEMRSYARLILDYIHRNYQLVGTLVSWPFTFLKAHCEQSEPSFEFRDPNWFVAAEVHFL
jgi:hypothetical protein